MAPAIWRAMAKIEELRNLPPAVKGQETNWLKESRTWRAKSITRQNMPSKKSRGIISRSKFFLEKWEHSRQFMSRPLKSMRPRRGWKRPRRISGPAKRKAGTSLNNSAKSREFRGAIPLIGALSIFRQATVTGCIVSITPAGKFGGMTGYPAPTRKLSKLSEFSVRRKLTAVVLSRAFLLDALDALVWFFGGGQNDC